MLKTLLDLGPLAASDREFSETMRDVLERTLQALDAHEGALFSFDNSSVRLTCVANTRFPGLTVHDSIPLGPQQAQNWMQAREAVIIKEDSQRKEYFAAQNDFTSRVRLMMPLRAMATFAGAICLGEREGGQRYGDIEGEALELLSGHLSLMLQNHTLTSALRVQVQDNLRLLNSLQHSYDDALEAFATTIDAKDEHMRGHSMRVGRYSAEIATSLGMSENDVRAIRAAGQLHDIGRVTVDKSVSNKTTKLLPEEFREIADHTVMGHQIVSSVKFPWPDVPEVVRWHHERADGTGYPDKLHSDDVNLPVRIVGVADTFEAMTSPRPYRRPLPTMDAAKELVRLSPTKFDPSVVQALLVQLRCQCDHNGKLNTQHGSEILNLGELDRLSVQLVHKLTGNRVYSA